MTFPMLRQLFKQIRKLETECPYLAATARTNLKYHLNQYQLIARNHPKKAKIKQYEMNLSAFIQLLSQANDQNKQLSQYQRMKLVEISCNLNKYVDSKFQFREDYCSKEMESLYNYQEFKDLKSEGQKKFVVSIIKKIFQGQETFQYLHLSDYLLCKHFKKPSIRGQQQFDKLDEETKTIVSKILKGDQFVTPAYRRIYQYYFSKITNEEITFESYLESLYILNDFDDLSQAWESNKFEKKNSLMIHSQRIKRLQDREAKNRQSRKVFLQQVQRQKKTAKNPNKTLNSENMKKRKQNEKNKNRT